MQDAETSRFRIGGLMMKTVYDFSVEKKFTETYKQYQNAHTAIREAKCLDVMYPAIFKDIQIGDKFAGRIQMSRVGFSPEPGGLGYYCETNAIRMILRSPDYSDELRAEMEEILAFWANETTTAKVKAAYTPAVNAALPSDNWGGEPLPAAPLYRMAGCYLDYDKLMEYGIPGLKKLAAEKKELAMQNGGDVELFTGMEMALDVFANCCYAYRDQALALMKTVDDADEIENLSMIAKTLENIAVKKPETMREAMQLHWLYTLICGSYNYGRLDVILGDFLARDLENNVLDMDQAQVLFNGLWRLIIDRKTTWNGRVILGGKGRRNEKYADVVAMLGMEASRVMKDIEPQLTLRIYDGMDPKLMEKALQVIGEGCTYPMLYNDDVNIPAVSNAFRIDMEEAEDYVPFGCGEYVINHKSYGTPNGVINLLKCLEVTLRNGRDGLNGKQTGIETGKFEDFKTFDELLAAYKKQVEYFVDALAKQEEIEYTVTGEAAPFLFISMLYDDCMERGKGIFAGGVKYLGGTIETYGNINTSDSLTAIKHVVYDKKLLTPSQLLTILDADFEGYETEKSWLDNAPKYGNDIAEADDIAKIVHEHICNTVRDEINKVNLHSYLVVIINNSANTTMGKVTAASADGRKKGLHMANANNPWGGNDKNGLSAMLNSLVKLRPDIHAGAVQNMKFSPELFANDGVIVKSVLKTYFENGGTQAMISVVNKNDLEQAMIHPEKYGNLFVRVGGFSARFVELEKAVQKEILSRTHY